MIDQYDRLETKFSAYGAHIPPPKVDADGLFQGYAAVFNQPDQIGDVIAPGAFANSLKTRAARYVKLLWQHEPTEPIGVWITLREDSHGLLATGKLTDETQRGRETLALLRMGALDGLSIGFRTVRAEKLTQGRKLQQIDLVEVSLVTFPMSPLACVQDMASDAKASALESSNKNTDLKPEIPALDWGAFAKALNHAAEAFAR